MQWHVMGGGRVAVACDGGGAGAQGHVVGGARGAGACDGGGRGEGACDGGQRYRKMGQAIIMFTVCVWGGIV